MVLDVLGGVFDFFTDPNQVWIYGFHGPASFGRRQFVDDPFYQLYPFQLTKFLAELSTPIVQIVFVNAAQWRKYSSKLT